MRSGLAYAYEQFDHGRAVSSFLRDAKGVLFWIRSWIYLVLKLIFRLSFKP